MGRKHAQYVTEVQYLPTSLVFCQIKESAYHLGQLNWCKFGYFDFWFGPILYFLIKSEIGIFFNLCEHTERN